MRGQQGPVIYRSDILQAIPRWLRERFINSPIQTILLSAQLARKWYIAARCPLPENYPTDKPVIKIPQRFDHAAALRAAGDLAGAPR